MAKHVNTEGTLFQLVRVADVTILGPIMIKAGRKIGGFAGTVLTLSGVGTIIFNAINFFDIEKEKN